MCLFLLLAAEKKDTIFGAARIFFVPSYFLTALEIFKSLSKYASLQLTYPNLPTYLLTLLLDDNTNLICMVLSPDNTTVISPRDAKVMLFLKQCLRDLHFMKKDTFHQTFPS